MNCPYNLCNGSGKIPLQTAAGFRYCECQDDRLLKDMCSGFPVSTEGRRPGSGSQRLPRKEPKGRMHLYEDDFDFPMSWSSWRSICLTNGWDNPGSDKTSLNY